MHLVIVLHAFNEKKSIGNVISFIKNRRHTISNTTVVDIDDCFKDKTKEIALENGALTVKYYDDKEF